jgi:FkbM family methyltransferase
VSGAQRVLDIFGQLAFLATLRDRYGITLDYESILERDYRRILGPGGVAVDVGAHCGRHTTVLASIVGETGKVLAFEPLPGEFSELQRLCGSSPQVSLHNVALADYKGESDFVFATGTPSESGLRARVFNAPDQARPRRIRVRVERLDDYTRDLPRLDFLKVDIEGGEIECLDGALDTLARLRPVVAVEYGAAGYAAYGHERATLFQTASRLDYVMLDLFGNVIESLAVWERVCDKVYWDYLLAPRERRDAVVRAITEAAA